MAITKIHAVKVRLGDAINYIENPDKTDGQELISGYNTAPQTAVLDFSVTAAMARKARNTSAKKQGNLAYHLIQSFSPDDAVTPERAHELGRKLAMEFTDGKFEFVVATHINKDSIHNHIIINAVSFYDYKKLRTVPYRTAQQIRSISDRLCMEAQLSIIKDPQQLGQLYPTYVQKKRTTSNRTEVRKKLNFCLERATNYAQFLQMAQELGISVCQHGKHMTYLPEGAGRAIRDTSLADTDKFTYTGLVERLEDNATEQLFIRERIAKILPNVSTFADFAKLLQSAGVKIRVKKQTGQLMYKAVDLDGTWVPADALGDGFTLAGLESAIKNKSENLDTNRSTPIAELYQELTTNYPQSCDTSVRLTSRQICSAGKRGVLLQIHDSSGNPAKLMIDNSHIHTTPDGSVSADIGAAFAYDITYDDGTHGTIRGTDLIRQIDEENLTQPLIVSLTADQIMAMSLRGVTVHLPQYHIERLFIPERYVQRNVEQGSCTISLYPDWQYSYVPIGSEKTRKSISGAELAQSLGGVVQVGTSESSLARRVANPFTSLTYCRTIRNICAIRHSCIIADGAVAANAGKVAHSRTSANDAVGVNQGVVPYRCITVDLCSGIQQNTVANGRTILDTGILQHHAATAQLCVWTDVGAGRNDIGKSKAKCFCFLIHLRPELIVSNADNQQVIVFPQLW